MRKGKGPVLSSSLNPAPYSLSVLVAACHTRLHLCNPLSARGQQHFKRQKFCPLMHWGFLPCSSSHLLASHQCTANGWICFTMCWHKSAWEEGRTGKLHLNLLHNPALTSFFLLQVWTDLAMPSGWILAQRRRSANQKHHELPPHKIKSLLSPCRWCSGHSMPGNIGHTGMKWFSLHTSPHFAPSKTPPAQCSETVSQAIAETIAVI